MTDNAIAKRRRERIGPPYKPVFEADDPVFRGEDQWHEDYALPPGPRGEMTNVMPYDLSGMGSLHPDAQRDLVPLGMLLRRSQSLKDTADREFFDREINEELMQEEIDADYADWLRLGKPGAQPPEFRNPGPGKWPGSRFKAR